MLGKPYVLTLTGADDDDPPGPWSGVRRELDHVAENSDEAPTAGAVGDHLSAVGESTGNTGNTGYFEYDFSFGHSDVASIVDEGAGITNRYTSLDDIARFYDLAPNGVQEGSSSPSNPSASPTPVLAAELKSPPMLSQQAPQVPARAVDEVPLPPPVDSAILKLSPSVPSFAHSSYHEMVTAWHKRQTDLGLAQGASKVAFPEGEKVTQIFIGQLPATVTHDVLSACVDSLLGLHMAAKILSMRPPPAGSAQSGHAILTIEAKYQRIVLSLNRRAYFTSHGVYYATQVKDTAAFQRLIAKALSPADAQHGPVNHQKLSRACIVVEQANLPSRPPSANTGREDRRTPQHNQQMAQQGRRAPPSPGATSYRGPTPPVQRHGPSYRSPMSNAAPPPPPPPYFAAAPAGAMNANAISFTPSAAPVVVPGYFIFCPAAN